MGISKSIWMAQSELEHVNNLLGMEDEEFFDHNHYPKPTEQLELHKANLEKELKELNAIGVRAGLVKA